MLDVTAYTSYNSVRAALGVSAEELDDTTLGLETYALTLEDEFYRIGPALVTDYDAIEVLIQAGTATTTQERIWLSVRLFAPYALARGVSSGLSMFGVKSITDGKASVTRFDGHSGAASEVSSQYNLYRSALRSLYAGYAGIDAPAAYVPALVSSPSYDPVIGS